VPGRPRDDDGVPVDSDLGAEPATHVGDDHPDAVGVEPERAGQHEAADLRVLAAHPDRQLAVLPGGGGGAALHRHRRDPLVHDVALDHDVTAVEGGVIGGLADRHHNVRSRVGEQERLPGQGVGGVHDRGQGLIIHADQFGGVLALVCVVGEHDGHRLAHEPYPVHRQ
jgi:hypothetical protein